MQFRFFVLCVAIGVALVLGQAYAEPDRSDTGNSDMGVLIEEALGDIHGHFTDDTMNALSKRLSKNQISEELLRIGTNFLHSVEKEKRNKAIRAIQLLGSYGTTNAVGGLGELLFSDDGEVCLPIARSLLSIDKYGDQSLELIEKFCKADDVSLEQRFFVYMALERGLDDNMIVSYTSRHKIVMFLLEQALADFSNSAEIDLMLCRKVHGYEKSRQRLDLARKVLRDAEDSGIQSHFRNVFHELSKIPEDNLENVSVLQDTDAKPEDSSAALNTEGTAP